VGGEDVCVIIRCLTKVDLYSAIIGFIVKDHLGQGLFGDNTFLTYRSAPLTVTAGKMFEARFEFRMPVLPVGDYSINVAVAEGTQEDHIQHHWAHDALLFKSHTSSVCTGLVGIPMRNIKLSIINDAVLCL